MLLRSWKRKCIRNLIYYLTNEKFSFCLDKIIEKGDNLSSKRKINNDKKQNKKDRLIEKYFKREIKIPYKTMDFINIYDFIVIGCISILSLGALLVRPLNIRLDEFKVILAYFHGIWFFVPIRRVIKYILGSVNSENSIVKKNFGKIWRFYLLWIVGSIFLYLNGANILKLIDSLITIVSPQYFIFLIIFSIMLVFSGMKYFNLLGEQKKLNYLFIIQLVLFSLVTTIIYICIDKILLTAKIPVVTEFMENQAFFSTLFVIFLLSCDLLYSVLKLNFMYNSSFFKTNKEELTYLVLDISFSFCLTILFLENSQFTLPFFINLIILAICVTIRIYKIFKERILNVYDYLYETIFFILVTLFIVSKYGNDKNLIFEEIGKILLFFCIDFIVFISLKYRKILFKRKGNCSVFKVIRILSFFAIQHVDLSIYSHIFSKSFNLISMEHRLGFSLLGVLFILSFVIKEPTLEEKIDSYRETFQVFLTTIMVYIVTSLFFPLDIQKKYVEDEVSLLAIYFIVNLCAPNIIDSFVSLDEKK